MSKVINAIIKAYAIPAEVAAPLIKEYKDDEDVDVEDVLKFLKSHHNEILAPEIKANVVKDFAGKDLRELKEDVLMQLGSKIKKEDLKDLDRKACIRLLVEKSQQTGEKDAVLLEVDRLQKEIEKKVGEMDVLKNEYQKQLLEKDNNFTSYLNKGKLDNKLLSILGKKTIQKEQESAILDLIKYNAEKKGILLNVKDNGDIVLYQKANPELRVYKDNDSAALLHLEDFVNGIAAPFEVKGVPNNIVPPSVDGATGGVDDRVARLEALKNS